MKVNEGISSSIDHVELGVNKLELVTTRTKPTDVDLFDFTLKDYLEYCLRGGILVPQLHPLDLFPVHPWAVPHAGTRASVSDGGAWDYRHRSQAGCWSPRLLTDVSSGSWHLTPLGITLGPGQPPLPPSCPLAWCYWVRKEMLAGDAEDFWRR